LEFKRSSSRSIIFDNLIEAYFGDGSELGIRLYYCSEDKPLGTAGALGNMLQLLDETFFLTNGDLLVCGRASSHRRRGDEGRSQDVAQ
jgi:NDP-sugar pyrophosphorylase family protein